ncbi:MAG: VWA domain-containing protein [Alphaproteobacteria bacterium]|nr:VWA domain-containing protein [Alphaproteobacteria bacterium]
MSGRLAHNIIGFCRLLRAAGLSIGPGRALSAVRAAAAVGLTRRDDFYWALHASLITRRQDRAVFDQAFHLFWRNPQLIERAVGLLLPTLRTDEIKERQAVAARLADALASHRASEAPQQQEVEVDAALTTSDRDVLQTRDFDQMSAAEYEEAKRQVRQIRLAFPPVQTRRWRPGGGSGRIDARRTLRLAVRTGGDPVRLAYRQRAERPPTVVVLCDISGSMGRYSRILLHFMHTLMTDRDRVHAFLFGTRLTNITRALRTRDVDDAVLRATAEANDWAGGTRIGQTLHEFNARWSRRVLGQTATVLLITDGLDRDAGEGLAREAERLSMSCKRLIWLNPLLRWDGFEPKARGVRALLPHVDEHRPVHSLASLADLARALTSPADQTVRR